MTDTTNTAPTLLDDGRRIVWYNEPLTRYVVKLVTPETCPTCGQAVGHPSDWDTPWDVLPAQLARDIADHVSDRDMYGIEFRTASILRTYADAVDAMLHAGYPERDMQTTDEELFF